RRGEAVGVALAPDLTVGDDVEPGLLLGANRQQRGVVLRLGEPRLGDAPQPARPHARREAPGEPVTGDEPLWLRVAADKRGGKQRRGASIHADAQDIRYHPPRPGDKGGGEPLGSVAGSRGGFRECQPIEPMEASMRTLALLFALLMLVGPTT